MAITGPRGAAPTAPVTAYQPGQAPSRTAPAVLHRRPRTAAPARTAGHGTHPAAGDQHPTEPARPEGARGHSGSEEGENPEHSGAPSQHGGTVPAAEGAADGHGAVRLAVHTADPITRLALVSYVRQFPHLALTRWSAAADIVIASLENPDAAAIGGLRRQLPGDPQLLLIVEGAWTANLHSALDAGVRAVIFRHDFTWDRFGEALREVQAGHGDLPTELQGRLMDQVRQTHREVLTPRGLTPGGLTLREADVLRLVAEGYELQDIGSKLGYSERTIKNVLYGVIKRHRLRNRAHSVAYAIRCGLI
ncbi:helix-turn-helix transcriptional regulator [Actinacidiphila rubida]|uniref:DNA-binding response regulator, NarL/FixJ family, contains REC and HTH domains n=1 Tax=Actinacidiphila rubida TaxID=310780 RepID=A0A1H8U8A1_9ACTN|nr:response regulator transcription factor [Actinacidiphila rubida]SEO99512.1 DNA-binding response regulator, NarL/FixJ family, contains REC and HTH domains [Actinacidiphila rubida]